MSISGCSRMESNFIFRAAKCVACSRLLGGSRILSAWQQATTLLKPTTSTSASIAAKARPFASCATLSPSSAQPSHAVGSGVAKTAFSSRTNTSSFLSGQTSAGTSLLQVASPVVIPARGRAHNYYRPSAWKRVNKHGMEKRLRSHGGIEVLWRRILKKRHCLTPFDRILPGAYEGKILPAHHLKYNQHLVSRKVRNRMNEALGKKSY